MAMDDEILAFYEALANDYHLIFQDWQTTVLQQGKVLHGLIQQQVQRFPLKVLDCSCGIGTQAIGLAQQGYTVHGTDLSPASVERAKALAEQMGVSASFAAADMRSLAQSVPHGFDVVISCDNALPHLLNLSDLQVACEQIYQTLRSGGLFIASIRDYDQLLEQKPTVTEPKVHAGPDGRRIVFQSWNWAADGATYRPTLFILKNEGEGWQMQHYTSEYRALRRQELELSLHSAGFSALEWHFPADSGYYQPIVIAHKR